MAGKRKGGDGPTPTGAARQARRRAGGAAGLVPGFSNDEQLALGAIHAQVIADARQDLLTAPDALAAESWASSTWGLAYGRELVGNDLEAVLGGGLVRYASHQRLPEALALLRALGSVAPAPYDVEAARAADALAEAGVEEPGWAASLGAATAEKALLVRDPVDDDGMSVFIGYRSGGREGQDDAHSLAVYIDHNLGGMAKDAFLGPGLAVVQAASDDEPERPLSVEAISLAQASWLVRTALEETDNTWDPPVTDAFRATRALLKARLRTIPHRAGTPLRVALDAEERSALVAAFVASPEAGHLDPDVLASIGGLPLQFSWEQVEGDPLRFSPTMVELFCADWAPRQLPHGPDELVHLPDVLRAWIRFAGQRRGLPGHRIEAALVAVDQWGEDLPPMPPEAEPWGPADLVEEEVDLCGPGAAGSVDQIDDDALTSLIDELIAPDDLESRGSTGSTESTEGLSPAGAGALLVFPGPAGTTDVADVTDLAAAAAALRAHLSGRVGEVAPAGLAPAAEQLRRLLRARTGFAGSVRTAAGFRRLPVRDDRLVTRATAAYLTMAEEPGDLGPAALSLVIALDQLDWLVLVVTALEDTSAVLDGAWAADVLRRADVDLDARDAHLVGEAFAIVTSPWRAAGVLAENEQLTELGAWVLPRALSHAWGYDFDTGRALTS